jgi:hypothetical protein
MMTPNMRALSIRQPYAEQILRGQKKMEYRSRPTNIRESVYIYASLTPGDPDDFRKMNIQPGELPTGLLVGTVEIVDCIGSLGNYSWILENPKRLQCGLKPLKHPQPVWFYPF